MNKKYISFVMTGRNDDYAKGFSERLQYSLNFLDYFADKAGLSPMIEIIFVEWNYLENRKPIRDIVNWPKTIPVRILRVPNEIHKSISKTTYDAPKGGTIPFFEFIAKNVGVRRSNADFVLCTNPDIIFNYELLSFFAKQELSKKRFYRIDLQRSLKPITESRIKTFEQWMKFMHRHREKKMDKKNRVSRKRWVHTKASGDFLLMPHWAFVKMKGYPEIKVDGGAVDRFGIYSARTVCKQRILENPMSIFHQPHARRDQTYRDKKGGSEYMSEHHTFSTDRVRNWHQKSIKRMETTKKNANPNGKRWGLRRLTLEEHKAGKQ
jgi:hypothetical protein